MKQLKKLVLIVTICFAPCLAFAQPDPGDDPDPVPIDGGASVLVAAAIAYGVKAMKKKKVERDK